MHNVLITGGTGYLGRALARRLLERQGVSRVCIFSRGEFAQALMRAELPDPDGKLRFFIGDVRERDRLMRAARGVDTIIHAAALKRVEVGEYNPIEMVRTNVLGSINVIEAAEETGVGTRVVAVSSDKACEPLNAYGATKLVMEKLTLAANQTTHPSARFSVVRYGNVCGSTGSVIPTWRQMIKEGVTEVPVSHPDCSRFWMTSDEAVDLIFWTHEHMEGGELVVPLLPFYRLEMLAKAMDLKMRVTGIGAGEKLDESMVAPMESPAFRYIDPYLVAGGIANRIKDQNVGGIQTHQMDEAELRERLAVLP